LPVAVGVIAAALVAHVGPPQEQVLTAQRQADTRYVEGVIYGARIATLKCYPTYTGKR
jgi:hypothetical protein